MSSRLVPSFLARAGRIAGVLAAFMGVAALTASAALAHPGHVHGKDVPGDGLGPDGRIPWKPDVDRVRGEVHRFDAERGGYWIKARPGEPEMFGHIDTTDPESTGAAGIGAHLQLPTAEDAPICATSGHRIKVVYAYDPGTASGAEMSAIVSSVRRMNAKLIQESQLSSGNTRTVQMRVDCNAPGEITLHQLATDYIDPSVIRSQAEAAFGAPNGANSVKYLIFRNDDHAAYGGIGFGYFQNAVKSASDGAGGNPNRLYTTSSVIFHDSGNPADPWFTHTTLHELMHSLGGTQYPSGDPAPFATPGAHCTDGIDILCYDDETLAGYNENRCWANGYNNTPAGVPLDCGYDTYFDAGSQPGNWLHTHWNVGGSENPFLVEIPAGPGIKGVAVTSSQSGRIDLFARGTDEVIRHRYHTAAGGWSAWSDVGTGATSDPAASSSSSGRLDLYVRRNDNAIWHRWYTPSTGWAAWGSIGASFSSGPGATSASAGRLDVFALHAGDNAMWHRWATASWAPWGSLGGYFTSNPDATSWGSGRLDVVVRGSDGAIWHRLAESSWGNWGSIGGLATSGPAAASEQPGGRLDVFARGTDNALWHRWASDATGWMSWGSLGGSLAASDPAAAYVAPGRLEAFVMGSDGALWQRTGTRDVGWSAWKVVE